MLKRIMSPFRCCLSPPSIPILIPAPIPLPDPIPDPIPDADAAEHETAEEEIDPIAMLAAVLAARAGRSARLQPSLDSILFPAPRRRVFKPTLDTIVEDPEAEEEAIRTDQFDILKAALEIRAQAIRAEAQKAEEKIAPDMEAGPKKRRKNWMNLVLSKCKRGRRDQEDRNKGVDYNKIIMADQLDYQLALCRFYHM
jgi:hypothetical protein